MDVYKRTTWKQHTVILLIGLIVLELASPWRGAQAEVPVRDVVTRSNTGTTAAKTTSLERKIVVLDPLATAVLKTAIKMMRDMVKRWIITGRFEGPVFSTSFAIDSAKAAENASRIFLSQLTGINFCTFISPPPIPTFGISADFGLSCTLPSGIDRAYGDTLIRLVTDPSSLSLDEYLALKDRRNIVTTNTVRLLDERERAIARATIAQSAEYIAGQGFLGIRDPQTGRIRTPGSAVAEEVKVSEILAPHLGSELADDVQTAIADIINTAVRAILEKGLGGTFGQSR